MTAREYLHQIKTLKYQIRVKNLELRGLRDDMTSLRSPALGDKVRNGKYKSFADQIEKVCQLESDIRNKTADKVDCLHDIHFKINSLDDELHVALLTDRYINNRSSDEVAKDINYTSSYVRRLTADAMEMFKEKFGDDF